MPFFHQILIEIHTKRDLIREECVLIFVINFKICTHARTMLKEGKIISKWYVCAFATSPIKLVSGIVAIR